MGKVIAISGQKGGTGKSVTAVNLAVSLALLEKKTLLIDCDPQGCSTQWSGIINLDYDCDLSTVFSAKAKFTEAIVNTEYNCLDILPSGSSLFQASLKLSRRQGNEKVLRLFLTEVKDDYDYILIDVPSSSGFLSIVAMTAAEQLVACMAVNHSRVEDYQNLVDLVTYIRETHKVPVQIAGVLFNRCASREEIFSYIMNQKLSQIEQMVYHSYIPEDESIRKSIELKMPIALHDIQSPASAAYLNLAKEILSSF